MLRKLGRVSRPEIFFQTLLNKAIFLTEKCWSVLNKAICLTEKC